MGDSGSDGSLHTMSVAIKSFTCRVNQVSSHALAQSSSVMGQDLQQLVARAVGWLCRRQFVPSELLPDLTYKVTRGSGMGLLHRGEVSDGGFWIAAKGGC